MRRRLTAIAGALVIVLLGTLMAPLAAAYANERTQDVFADRLTDVTRFAVLAQDVLEAGDAEGLEGDLVRYTEVYGGHFTVFDADRRVVASAGAAPRAALAVSVEVAVTQALAGASTPPPATVWPWGEDTLVISSPVGRDAQVLGAVVLLAPTQEIRRDVGVRLAWLMAVALAVLLLVVLGLVGRFVSWILRPVQELDEAATRLAEGDLAMRVPARAGPPELRHLASSFNQMADHVETSQRQQKELIADASHQLGNPLTALRIRVENLRSAPDVEEADLALEEADRLNAIVESLLDLSQVGAQIVEAQAVDLVPAVRHRCQLWAPVIDKLTVQTPEALWALATPDLVDLILDAVLDNAAKFARGESVSVVLAPDAVGVRLTVCDAGPGLPRGDVAKVGARFFRGRDHQNIPGTGLGLAIVRARVESVGGSFSVSQPPIGGLEVTVRLAAAAPPR